MKLPFTWMYMLYSEWLVTEQNTLYNKAQSKRVFLTWPAIDFSKRVFTKGMIRVATVVAGKGAAKLSTKLALNDERNVAHMED